MRRVRRGRRRRRRGAAISGATRLLSADRRQVTLVFGCGQAHVRKRRRRPARRADQSAAPASRRAAPPRGESQRDDLVDTQAVRVARSRTARPLTVPTFDQLLARLVHADVRFVVIGGLALGSWGVVRGTKDCDIVPDPAPENLDRLAHLVAELGGHVQLGEALLGSERSIAALLRGGERALIATQLGHLAWASFSASRRKITLSSRSTVRSKILFLR